MLRLKELNSNLDGIIEQQRAIKPVFSHPANVWFEVSPENCEPAYGDQLQKNQPTLYLR